MIAVLVAGFLIAGDGKPEALQRFHAARAAIKSGDITWSRVRESALPGREFTFVNKYARNGDRIFQEWGDQDGWVHWNPDGESGFVPASTFPNFYMVNQEGVWERWESQTSAEWWKLPPPTENAISGSPPPDTDEIKDIRSAGMHVSFVWSNRRGPDCLWGSDAGPNSNWAERVVNGKHIVSCDLSDGSTSTWTIDPERGWNAEKIVGIDPAGNRFETVCQLRQYGQTWFPEQITSTVNGEIHQTFTTQTASFNAPDDPEQFTGADFGFEPGFQIMPQNFRVVASPYTLFWTGEELVDFAAYKDRLEGGLEPGPTVQALARGERGPYHVEERFMQMAAPQREKVAQSVRGVLSLWERYTLHFIAKHALQKEQTERAMEVLKRCQERGGEYLDRTESDIVELKDQLLTAQREGNTEQDVRLTRRLDELKAPLDKIFERGLKPGLEKLPTKAQRAAVENKKAKFP